MVVALAREVEDGDLVTQGIGTNLPTCAYFLAKATHAPGCSFLYSAGGAFSNHWGPVGLTNSERLALHHPIRLAGYAEIVCDVLPGMPFKEFSRPAQVDRFGNTNNIVIGPYESPKVRLPGAGGIPDFSPYASDISLLYVPRHDRRTLVERLDFRSGIGRLAGESEEQRLAMHVTGRGARRVITDLAIIDFRSAGPLLVSLHTGVDVDQVIAATGFEVDVPSEVSRTPEPTDDELALIDRIDPLGTRHLEFVPAAKRLARIRDILRQEALGLDQGAAGCASAGGWP